MHLLAISVRALLLAFLPISLPRAQQEAWAWVQPAGHGATWVPQAAWQYTTSGSTISVDRDPVQLNRFLVKVPGMAPTTIDGGVVHASAYGGDHTVVINSWLASGADLHIWVECFGPGGVAADNASFTVLFRNWGLFVRRDAYVWGNQPTTASYSPPTQYTKHSSPIPPTITRLGPGRYRVTLFAYGDTLGNELGHVQVTPYSTGALWARVVSWVRVGNDVQIDVGCSDANGAAIDGRFTMSYCQRAAPIQYEHGSGAHVWADQPSALSYAPDPAYADSNGIVGPNGAERIERTGTGSYRVHLPDVVPSMSTTAQVSAYGLANAHATLDGWGPDGASGTYVYVRTRDIAGNPIDSRFTLLYLTNRPPQYWGWARVDTAGHAAGQWWAPDPSYAFCSTGEQVLAVRNGNYVRVRFPGVERHLWNLKVSAIGGAHVMDTPLITNGLDYSDVDVELFDAGGAPLGDGEFTVFWRLNGDPADRSAFVAGDQYSNPAYTATTYWNGDRGAPSITRLGTGRYSVTIPGIGLSLAEHGHVQVGAHYSGSPVIASVESWTQTFTDTTVVVQCRDLSGALLDYRFALQYDERAALVPGWDGSGAHLWADQPTASSYTPHPAYADSNGTLGPHGAETITRLGTGHYRVALPDVAPAASAIVQVSGYGTTGSRAAIDSWGPDNANGTIVDVRTYGVGGSPADARFLLSYVTDRPALGAPATANTFGTACNGPQLTAATRPVAGTHWDLALTSVPAGAQLGFVQLGLTNPNLPVGAGAPGCTQYTSGEAVRLLLLPVPTPAYRLTIPAGPAFLGMSIFAQGGALVPGVNALSLAASNGVVGAIGEV